MDAGAVLRMRLDSGPGREAESVVTRISVCAGGGCITLMAARSLVRAREVFRRPASGNSSQGVTRILQVD
jgi:hypothetical protein